MKVSDAFSGEFLKASDLHGKTVTVTIDRVGQEEFGQNNDLKWVMSFHGKDKRMVLNKTNATVIAQTLGDEMDLWSGRQIVIRSEKVNFQGKIVDGLRVHVPIDQGAAPAQAEAVASSADPNDDIPF